jgi:methylenetetrahydrofolate dehydrogenase (NADP+)/methenyltetrahydrofolate cyclohydrolase
LSAAIIDGKRIADEIKQEVKTATDRFRAEKKTVPGLAFILVGDNPASHVYVRMKRKACEEMGFYSVTVEMPESTSEQAVLAKVDEFNRDPRVHGILVQLPLPRQISEENVVEAIDPRKDVDGLHPTNVGKLVMGEAGLRPCTPVGVQELLLRSGNDPAGKHVVILGRSNLVGRPLANILSQKQTGANAVVTVCHTGARDISIYTKQADILVAAMGKTEIIKGDMIKPGAVVIDVGTNRVSDPSAKSGHRLVGDVHFESASKVARAITPVPGGVGPMTIAILLRNTLEAAKRFSMMN